VLLSTICTVSAPRIETFAAQSFRNQIAKEIEKRDGELIAVNQVLSLPRHLANDPMEPGVNSTPETENDCAFPCLIRHLAAGTDCSQCSQHRHSARSYPTAVRCEEIQQLFSADPLAEYRSTAFIHSVSVKNILGDI
jgi:hypothetical protein